MSAKQVYWMGEIPSKCQLSGKQIATEFVDGRVPGRTAWAIMDRSFFLSNGGTLGLGCGQLYRKMTDGRWLKVQG